MAVQQYQWMGTQAPRAKGIPASIWASHKDLLEDLYQKMKLEDVMSTMREKHSFDATRRQYVFQFRKWGFQKHNRNNLLDMDPDDSSSQPSISSLPAAIKTPQFSGSGQWSLTPISLPPSPPLSLFPPLRATESDDPSQQMLSSGKRKAGSPAPPQKRIKPSVSSSEATTEYTTSTSIALNTTGELYPIYATQQIVSSGNIHPCTSESGDVSGSHNVQDFVDRQTDALSSTPGEVAQVDQGLLQLDVSEPFEAICDLQHDRVEDLVIAADFLAISQCPADAFVLYLLLLKRHLAKSDLSGWVNESVTIGCVKSAVSLPHLHIVKTLFQDQLGKASQNDQFAVPRFIQHTFLADINKRLGEKSAAASNYSEAEKGIRTLVAQHHTLSAMHDDERALFLGACRVLGRSKLAASSDTTVPGLKSQLDDLIMRQSHYNVVGTFDKTVRSCLEWCLDRLKQRSSYPLMDLIGSNTCASSLFAAYLSLYYWLFQTWLTDRDRPERCHWMVSIKTKTALSPAKFLAVIAFLLSDYGPLKHKSLALPYEQLDTLLAAAEGICGVLIKFRVLELASVFTKALNIISDDGLGQSEFLQSTYETGLRPFATGLIEDCLNLKLSVLPPLDLIKLDDTADPQIEREPSSRPTSEAIPTLAPSPRSSDYLSLISLKNRLIGRQSEGYDATLPSNFLKHGSRSTLSILLAAERWSLSQRSGSLRALSHVGSDTLDALAAFSARTRSGISRAKHGSQAETIDIDSIASRYSNLSVHD